MNHVKLIGFCIAGLLVLVMILVQLQKRRQQKVRVAQWNENWDGAERFDEILGVHKISDGVRVPVSSTPERKTPSLYDEFEQDIEDLLDIPNQSDIFALQVLAPQGQQFIGYGLLQALNNAGLTFGEMDIFHYYDDQQEVVFSVAQATEPGTFDMDHIGGFSCLGLTAFIQFKGDSEDRNRLQQMFVTVSQLSQDLDAVVVNTLNNQPISSELLDAFNT